MEGARKATGTPLEELGMPLFYRVDNADAAGFSRPDDRHGQSVRTWVRSLTAMQKQAVVRSTASASGAAWRLASDEGWYLNGADVAPCPLAFLTAGMAASYADEITALARQQGIRLFRLKLVLDNRYTMDGSIMRGTMEAGALAPELAVHVARPDCDDATLRTLVVQAVDASPLNGLMRGALTSLFTLTSNGERLGLDAAAPLAGDALPDPGDNFPLLRRDGDETIVQPIITKIVQAEKEDSLQGGGGSSLQDQQKWVLHLRGTCMVRPNGIKEIFEEQFSPVASSWRFLSEEGPVYGGLGRAPDAASYISAGIGFCFMTQFGRYAMIQKKGLEAYRLVQDTHFSAGGASGETGKPGSADAVESHVYLDQSEDEDFARTILDASEQTCFLHAFCRTDLKAKVRIVRD